MKKSNSKINMERALLEAFYQMTIESTSPEASERVFSVISELCKTRGLGEFNFYPRENEANG